MASPTCQTDGSEAEWKLVSHVGLFATALVAAWLVSWIWLPRLHLLDDALIHLRYASNLAERGYLSYDGVTSTFGTSSLGYVLLLALLSSLTNSPIWVPKVVSVAAHLATLLLALSYLRRSVGRARVIAWALILALLSPMAMRWLTDGMETSLAVLLAVLVGQWSRRSGSWYVGFLLGVLSAALRIELCLWIGLVSISVALRGAGRSDNLRCAWLSLGGFMVVVGVWAFFGQILPDPAFAKSAGPSLSLASAIVTTHVSAMSVGMGVATIYLASFYTAFRAGVHRPAVLVTNLGPIIIALLAMLRGQSIEGVRYFLPFEISAIVVNLLDLSASQKHPSPLRSPTFKWIAVAFAVIWCAEIPLTARILSARSRMLAAMKAQSLHILQHERGVAADVGFIGYFSQAALCDLNGLVNGRAFAQRRSQERLVRCSQDGATFLFINKTQGQALYPHLDFGNWIVCHEYETRNLRSGDTHYLVVKPDVAAGICPSPLGLASTYWPPRG